MNPSGGAAIRFTLNGRNYELTHDDVAHRLAGVTPEPIRKHAVRVNDTWFPVMQAFEVAMGISRSDFISHTARRHLSTLGFEAAGEIEPRNVAASSSANTSDPQPAGSLRRDQFDDPGRASEAWHTEANVQATLVTALTADGWQILSVANTATKERGVDVIASRDGQTLGVEVKGFPSRGYADPARAGEVKPTAPSTQAGHWYAQAVLAAMRLRGREPHWRSVIALPDFPRYRSLHGETAGSLVAAQIGIWWVDEDGGVHT